MWKPRQLPHRQKVSRFSKTAKCLRWNDHKYKILCLPASHSVTACPPTQHLRPWVFQKHELETTSNKHCSCPQRFIKMSDRESSDKKIFVDFVPYRVAACFPIFLARWRNNLIVLTFRRFRLYKWKVSFVLVLKKQHFFSAVWKFHGSFECVERSSLRLCVYSYLKFFLRFY